MEDLNPGWRTSSRSGNGGECVEVGRASDGMIMVRDTKDCPDGPACRYTPAGWRAFVARVRSGTPGLDEPGRRPQAVRLPAWPELVPRRPEPARYRGTGGRAAGFRGGRGRRGMRADPSL
jgi:hypothetical protein